MATMSISWFLCLAVVLTLAYLCFRSRSHSMSTQSDTGTPSRGYLLTNKVTHARLFPIKHVFTYPTLSVLVSLDALESCELDLRVPFGVLFGQPGLPSFSLFRFGRTWWTLLGLRGDGYLGPGSRDIFDTEPKCVSIRRKLDRVLIERGVIADSSEIRDAWMMTMPAICGFEGINPLTVYFCYGHSEEVSIVILEVHNTFGEGHIYVLQIGKNEDSSPPRGYDHQWTFPRRFFVSPFNDRSGFYTVAVKLPSHPPFDLPPILEDLPKPSVRVHLHVPASSCSAPLSYPIDQSNTGPLKLVAHLTPKDSVPLTSCNILTAFFHHPLALFSTLPRIMYRAWILHYRKHLPIFARPEPITGHLGPSLSTNPEGQGPHPTANDSDQLTQSFECPGGVISHQPSFFDRYSRNRMEQFLSKRCKDLKMRIVLVPGDPAEDVFWLGSPTLPLTLTVKYTSPRFFTLFLLAPSPRLFLLAGCKSKTDGERPLFEVSDEAVFMRFFDPVPGVDEGKEIDEWMEWATQQIRLLAIPSDAFSEDWGRHPLTRLHTSFWRLLCDFLVVCTLVLMDRVQEWVFWLLSVRFVEGTEPWWGDVWRRASRAETKTKDGL